MMFERKQVGLFAGIAALFQEKACLFAAKQHQKGPCGQFVNRPKGLASPSARLYVLEVIRAGAVSVPASAMQQFPVVP